ncbi:hypothetical protein H3H54_14220 [Brachybacterium sp. Z12]|uniref:hypothetical protein n=1 Tax=Brachybacterium sp. Z12 TaxID=2759167 RepID=UPI001860531E|nr:hypothetical protein [Brachybacterium sp. Z12]QNN82231.1 hypothetical protein H3H54_14220 [Brachybacterium sp. Z12]
MDIPAERFFTLLSALIDLLEHREEKPHPSSRLERSARLLPGHEPGTGILQIVGPIPEILSRWKTLDEAARAIQTAQRTALREGTPIPHDPDGDVLATGRALPLTQLRYLLMSLAELDLEGVEVPTERFRLNITVPVLTLLGASDEPGTLDGTTPLPPSMARSLAGSAQVWHRVLTEPTSGAFLPLPADRYVPTASMLEHLRLRNSLCAVPGCTRPTSWASECDHIEECRRGTPAQARSPRSRTSTCCAGSTTSTRPTACWTPPVSPPEPPNQVARTGASAPTATLSPSPTRSTPPASRWPRTSPSPGPASCEAPTPGTSPHRPSLQARNRSAQHRPSQVAGQRNPHHHRHRTCIHHPHRPLSDLPR